MRKGCNFPTEVNGTDSINMLASLWINRIGLKYHPAYRFKLKASQTILLKNQPPQNSVRIWSTHCTTLRFETVLCAKTVRLTTISGVSVLRSASMDSMELARIIKQVGFTYPVHNHLAASPFATRTFANTCSCRRPASFPCT